MDHSFRIWSPLERDLLWYHLLDPLKLARGWIETFQNLEIMFFKEGEVWILRKKKNEHQVKYLMKEREKERILNL